MIYSLALNAVIGGGVGSTNSSWVWTPPQTTQQCYLKGFQTNNFVWDSAAPPFQTLATFGGVFMTASQNPLSHQVTRGTLTGYAINLDNTIMWPHVMPQMCYFEGDGILLSPNITFTFEVRMTWAAFAGASNVWSSFVFDIIWDDATR